MKKINSSFYSLLSVTILCFINPYLNGEQTSKTTSTTTASTPSQPNEDIGIISFTPPAGWHLTDTATLPKSVKIMVVGKGQKVFPPSMNLSTEPFKGTLKDYLKIVKSMNEAHNNEWKDLGTIRTEAGIASLSQVDNKAEWGDLRLMHVILLKNGRIYILTASALKEEFSNYYKDFFNAMKSLRLNKDLIEMLTPQRKSQTLTTYNNLKNEWQKLLAKKRQEQPEMDLAELKITTFNNEEFQKNTWIPFKDLINQKYIDMGSEWQTAVLQKAESDLFIINP